jgi:hypothetical protein
MPDCRTQILLVSGQFLQRLCYTPEQQVVTVPLFTVNSILGEQ